MKSREGDGISESDRLKSDRPRVCAMQSKRLKYRHRAVKVLLCAIDCITTGERETFPWPWQRETSSRLKGNREQKPVSEFPVLVWFVKKVLNFHFCITVSE